MTGIWCILTVWSLFQSPRHWAALCCELLLLMFQFWKKKSALIAKPMRTIDLSFPLGYRISFRLFVTNLLLFSFYAPILPAYFSSKTCQSLYVSIAGSTARTLKYRRSACWGFWYSCNRIHTSTRYSMTSCIISSVWWWYHCFLSVQALDPLHCFAGSWDDVFKVAVALYLIGTLVWNLFSTGEKILDWEMTIRGKKMLLK